MISRISVIRFWALVSKVALPFRLTLAVPLFVIVFDGSAQEHRLPLQGRSGPAPVESPRVLPPSVLSNNTGAPMVALPELRAENITTGGRLGMPRVGQNRAVESDTLRGGWYADRLGKWYWTVSLRSPGAKGMRLHFLGFDVGEGQVWIHDGDPKNGQVFGPFTGRGPFGDGDFWTEMVFQDVIYVEYRSVSGNAEGAPRLRVAEIFHLWTELGGRTASLNVGCFLDEMCYGGNAWVGTFSNGVAYLLFADHTCSGTLINDRNSTNTPYLLTAGHCIADQTDARNMLAVFKFRTNACNGSAGYYNQYPQVSGADLLAQNVHLVGDGNIVTDQPDFAFVRLTGYPATNWYAMGFNTGPSGSDRLTSVSHPRNLPQTVAFGVLAGASSYFYTVRMGQGAVDHGSSGSGLVNDSDQLVGVFSYLPNGAAVSSCDVGNRDYGYTQFAAIYPAIRTWIEAPAPVAKASMVSPATGSILPSSSATFTWTSPTGATGYSLSVGSQVGAQDLFARDFGTATSGTVTGLPTDGRLLFVRLTTRSASGSSSNDYIYNAFSAPAPQISTVQLNNATSGVFYSQQLTATGGRPPYFWSFLSGGSAPPSWLNLAASGVLSGNPSSCGTGSVSFGVSVTDSVGASSTKTLYLLVTGGVSLSPVNLSVGASSGVGDTAVGAPPGCTWTATSNTSWIVLTSGGGGSGPGRVTFSFTSNPSANSRTGAIIVSGVTFAVTQAGFDSSAASRRSFEPALTRTFTPGFYILEANLDQGEMGGFWGLEVLASKGQAAGGFNLGGAVQEQSKTPGFGAFYVASTQNVTATLNAQTTVGTALTMRFLDSQKRPIGNPVLGVPPLALQNTLTPGFYVVEVSQNASTPFTFQLGLNASSFAGGVDTGGYIGPGVTGFGAFYIPETQDVTMKMYGRNTYGSQGAGNLILTLRDSNRTVLQSINPPALNVWKGTGTTALANFGGPPYCYYQVTMSNLQLSVTADQSFNITSVALTGTMTETALNGCPYAPAPQNNHSFNGTGTYSGGSVVLQFTGAASNIPLDSASFSGRVVNGRLVGTLTIRRIDQTGVLAWVTQHAVQ